MVFKSRKVNGLAMMESKEIIKTLSPYFHEYGILLSQDNYYDINELTNYLYTHENVDFVMLSDKATSREKEGVYEYIKKILEIKRDIYIAVFFDIEKKDEKLISWANQLGFKSFYYLCDPNYADDEGYDFSLILPEISKYKDEYHRLENYKGKEENIRIVEVEKKVEVEKIIEKRIEIPVEVEKIVEKRIEVPVEVERKIEIEKPVELAPEIISDAVQRAIQESMATGNFNIGRNTGTTGKKGVGVVIEKIQDIHGNTETCIHKSEKKDNSITIGVFTLSSGAGATTTAVTLAESLSKVFSTAVISFDMKEDLLYVPLSKVDYYVPVKDNLSNGEMLTSVKEKGYNIIIIDFGSPMKINPEGIVKERNEAAYRTLKQCHYKVCLGFNNRWNTGRVNYFLSNEDYYNNASYIIAIDNIKNAQMYERYNMYICERNIEMIKEKLYLKMGL